MSELIQKQDNRATIRRKLLTGASALALTAYVSCGARAEDSGQPQIWIELGGQLSRLSDGQESFAPVFPNSPARPSIFSPSQKFDGPPRFGLDEEGKLSFQADDSDWVFSASVRYGRSSNNRHVRQQTNPPPFVKYYYTSAPLYTGAPSVRRKGTHVIQPEAAKFADTFAQNSERHFILDFQAGKDVGLGMFGSKDGSSVVSLGVRFAQFSSKSNIAVKSNPDWKFNYKYFPSLVGTHLPSSKLVFGSIFHSNAASLYATRGFHGIGPSLSWSASAPFAGSVQDGQLTFDWGLNAALLFGRQKARTHHQTTGRYHGAKYAQASRPITYHAPATPDHTRSRNVSVPNVGGFAGLSFRYTNAKVSIGYRADMFFNAMDGGIDARKSENRGFYGPYASISVGLGD
jgi:iron complex outermembrane recepter protein